MPNGRVVVIGAGTAGICAAKVAHQHGLEVTVYEQSNKLGGNWNYTDRVGPDEFGLTYGFMYQGLVTNVPKEIMGFPDMAVPERDHSFLQHEEVLDYLRHYAKHFDVERHIGFRHEVIRVHPRRDGSWEVIVRNVVTNSYTTEFFDYVMICTGHDWSPRYPHMKGENLFKGTLKHSTEFRRKEEFAGQRVCVIGSGSSGVDIAVMLCQVCPEVILSQHLSHTDPANFPTNLKMVPDVQELTESGLILQDGTHLAVDTILYCTGFNYSFPFLSTDCGVQVDDNCVEPLFKHLINSNHPTMAFIGLNFHLFFQLVVDLQARACVKFWTTGRHFPPKAVMLESSKRDLELRLAKGWKRRHAHRLWDLLEEYCRDLAEWADIPGIEPVYLKIYFDAIEGLHKNYQTYRKSVYRIVDAENFEKTLLE